MAEAREQRGKSGFIARVARNRWGVFGFGFVLTLVPMLLWNLASPIGSSPDEPTHFVRAAAVVRGEVFTGALKSNPRLSEAEVPEYVAWVNARTCYAFNPNITAACVHPVPGNPNRIVQSGHTAAANSPVFYALTGLPSLVLSGDKALYAMRGVNSLLCAAMFGFIFLALSQLARPRWSYFAAFVSATPMVLYLGGTLNPNGIEAVAAGSLFAALTVLASRVVRGARMIELLGVVVLSTIMLTATRNISLLWLLLAVGMALLLGRKAVLKRLFRRPAIWVTIALAALVSLAELIYFLRPSVVAQPQQFYGAGSSFRDGLIYMVQHTFDFATGWVGLFGWVDTPAPSFTQIVWAALMIGLVLGALILGKGARRLSVILMLVAMVAVPAIAQAAVINRAGFIWQGRYTLAIVIILLLASGVVLDRCGFGVPILPARRAATWGVWLMAVGQVFAFVVAVKRYVVGDAAFLVQMVRHPAWQPPGTWEVLSALFALSIVAAAIVATKALAGVDRRFTPVSRPEPAAVPVS